MSDAPRNATLARLMPLAGPPIRPIHLLPRDGGTTIGRQDTCDVRLPSDAVSRLHAKLFHDAAGQWRLRNRRGPRLFHVLGHPAL